VRRAARREMIVQRGLQDYTDTRTSLPSIRTS
jgi:hypothetical protein